MEQNLRATESGPAAAGSEQKRGRRWVLGCLVAAGCLLLVGVAAGGWYLATHWDAVAGRGGQQRNAAARRGGTARNRAAAPEAEIAGQLLQARFGAPAAFVNGKVYVFGGSNGYALTAAECYDPAARRSRKLAADLLPRAYHLAQAIDGKVYITGGQAKDGVTGVLEIFDPATGEVTTGAPMPTPRFNAGAAVLDGKLYVAGGSTGSATDLTDALEIYDPETDRWTTGAPLPDARQTELIAWGRKLYAQGGYAGDGSTADCWAYDPRSDAWKELPQLPVPASAHRGAALGDELYLFGSYEKLGQVLRFKDRRWQEISIGFLPRRHAGIANDGERVWVIGGTTDGHRALNAVQEFGARELAQASAAD